MATGKQYCTFFLDGLFFGVEVEKVQEVIRYQEMTQVPLAPSVVRGLINLRGQIVMALDLRRRIELPDRADDALPMNVVIRTEESAVSLLVDEIGDVIEVDEDGFERPPENLKGASRDLIRGAYKLKDRLLIVLDANKIVQVDSAS